MTASVDFKALYNDYLKKVEAQLEQIVKDKKPESLYAPFHYLITGGGKRIRPVLTMLCCGAVGGNPIDALDAGVAIEILHNFTLVHDDIMDKSPMRRNRPTVHVKWSEASAILAGDVMVGYAYSLLPSPKVHPRSHEIYQAFTQSLIEVCEGQAYDMDFNERDDVNLDEYLIMIDKKTAKLIETSALIGGHFGNANEQELDALQGYAYAVGIAFQIQDDLLDLTAEQAELGKTIGQDIVEGKKTFLIIKAIETARTEQDKALLKEFLNNHGLPPEKVPEIKEMLSRLGVLYEAQAEIDRYFSQAKNYLKKLPENQSTQILGWLLETLNKRKH
jgi:geranylgeranyl diphosphate synthase type II